MVCMEALLAFVLFSSANGVSTDSSPNELATRAIPVPTRSIKLESYANHYMVQLRVGGDSANVDSIPLVIDTGSADLVLLKPPTGVYVPNNLTARALADKQVYEHALAVDGDQISFESCVLISDRVELADDPSVSVVSTMLYAARLVYDIEDGLSKSVASSLHNWTAAGGLLGMAYERLAHRNSSWMDLLSADEHSPRIFALDLQLPPQESWLHMHGVPPEFSEIVWSEAQPMPDETLQHYTLPLFDLSVCGVGMLANFSSHWFAIVDTGAVCLSLPGQFFDMLMVWIPSECYGDGYSQTCLLPTNTSVSTLPELTFSLGEGSSQKLRIPLSQLLLLQKSGRYAYCIKRLEDIPSSPPQHISFGTMVLRALFVVFDVDARRLGFVSKSPPDDSSTQRCTPVKECASGQTLYLPLNLCEEPACGEFYFKEVDLENHVCRYTTGFVVMSILPLLVCVGADFVLHRNYKRHASAIRHRLH